ncbi:MAG: polysaccharide export protein [Pseudomonadales bacterium]|nr:polysaccharide export protein [Pseudomonadales bacterium]
MIDYYMRIYAALLLLLFLKPVLASESSLLDYKLGSGDLINIVVFGELDLSLEVRLSDAGTVSYPFLGELKVNGLTSRDLEHLLTEGLKGDYLVEPRVNVSIKEYRQFFIAGEVANPGGFEYSPGLTLRKAIALAGGFTERASKSKMYVIAGSGNDKKIQMSLGDLVKPGDTVTIEQSFF